MDFRTQIKISQSNKPIDYQSKVILLGSCFAENMGDKFSFFKFQQLTNPFGIIFNPVSIEKIICKVVQQEVFSDQDIFFYNESWHCFDIHSDLNHSNKELFLKNLNSIIQSFRQTCIESSHFIITYGTSWVYRNKHSNAIVANCHKVPQKEFDKELLSCETIQQSIKNTIRGIKSINPEAHFIFTVSPVRHLKDGFVENQISKAHLIAAIHQQLQTEYGKRSASYFPSFEIMMDELRDYRFYAQDMLHPSAVAIDYIWQRFSETRIFSDAHPIMELVTAIQKGLAHRPFDSNSEKHQLFLAALNKKKKYLAIKHPQIQF